MLSKGWLPKEGLSTLITLIGFRSSVDFLMYNKGRFVNEGFPTLIAFIGSLSSMTSLVLSQTCLHAESFLTTITSVGFLSCMDSVIYNDGGHFIKGFSAFLIFIWLPFNTSPLLCGKDQPLVEGLLTLKRSRVYFKV